MQDTCKPIETASYNFWIFAGKHLVMNPRWGDLLLLLAPKSPASSVLVLSGYYRVVIS